MIFFSYKNHPNKKRWLKSEILQGALSENPLTMEYESI